MSDKGLEELSVVLALKKGDIENLKLKLMVLEEEGLRNIIKEAEDDKTPEIFAEIETLEQKVNNSSERKGRVLVEDEEQWADSAEVIINRLEQLRVQLDACVASAGLGGGERDDGSDDNNDKPLSNGRRMAVESKGEDKAKMPKGEGGARVRWSGFNNQEKGEWRCEAQSAVDVFAATGKLDLSLAIKLCTIQDLCPEAATTSQALEKAALSSRIGHRKCQYHWKNCDIKDNVLKVDESDGEGSIIVEWVASSPLQSPAEGFFHCRCDEESSLFEFFCFKTWGITSKDPDLVDRGLVPLKDGEVWLPCVQAFVAQNRLKFWGLSLEQLYFKECLHRNASMDLVLKYGMDAEVLNVPKLLSLGDEADEVGKDSSKEKENVGCMDIPTDDEASCKDLP
ncbi:hypothetical protein BDQ12DRAFT_728307 [Crucibulum laeve]|uniref:Uncharacterized protein n=1 Tax=Crucibulum laeve TaxID=68775 RepID=A0A5C3LJU1_9AGAR|nr:hypothetical protein BDQ12DRAFT_728307 [Crucibulum laeve]